MFYGMFTNESPEKVWCYQPHPMDHRAVCCGLDFCVIPSVFVLDVIVLDNMNIFK